MIPARTVIGLGLSQLIGWGVSFYLIGNFGQPMRQELGWSATLVYAGMSWAIVCMALSSALAGRAIDRWGGRRVMPAGAALMALGCLNLALTHHAWHYFLSWTLLGLGMRLALYDAAFAALAYAAGPGARRAMSQITLFGGLASTVMWPAGQAMAALWGWRGALLAYAALALALIPLHRTLPRDRAAPPAAGAATTQAASGGGTDQLLYMVVVMLTSFLASGNATHLIALLQGLGLAAQAAVGVAALWGVGQVGARLLELAFGGRLHPVSLNLLTAAGLPLALAAGLAAADPRLAALYALGYGACNGLLTITRGTLALTLFDRRHYGRIVGRLLVPSFLLSAAAPSVYAYWIDTAGPRFAMGMSVAAACVILLASAALAWRHRPA
ncbi:MFS transporter [Bordetella hinzii]|uniref:MFS transporter n=2 Tax=Bordetella hinzii TaxID=103855 RepID=A0AAN1RW68_9BORD|nr:MFS transporter [Bordetella hinzii]AKQ53733.1 Major Facilitator Superfamily protein [Bordetella hinzii]AKQ58274.1 Major Facilitator Superfamily protein [Bordetella hinzii]AZW16387.1 MFS transporter [Bordetella hinzii]KCB21876.1 transporter, major facilitator family protein [Bordetella hinzii OH87 BAL007II]KCB33095.1 transporter, major facilitator family protein [Bordetella hinzii L60]